MHRESDAMAEVGPAVKRPKLATEVKATPTPAADVIAFHLVEGVTPNQINAEIDAGGITFHGEFFHQHFGEEEEIKGYADLHIDIWMSACTYHTWIDVQHTGRRPGATKLQEVFKENFPSGYCTKREAFVNQVSEAAQGLQEAIQSGRTLEDWTTKDGTQLTLKHYKLVEATQVIQDIHGRLEALLLFFIDGASFITVDERWDLLLVLKTLPTGGQAIVGLETLYNFWAYPESLRVRLSQVLVLPPWQSLGIGKKLLQHAYALANEKKVLDMTVEDPTPNLQRVREKLEVEMMIALPWVMEQASACIEAAKEGRSSWPSSSGASDETTEQATADAATSTSVNPLYPPSVFIARITEELKIYKSEARMAWEALLWLQPGAVEHPTVLSLLESMIKARLEASNFTSGVGQVSSKQILSYPGWGKDNWLMMKVKAEDGAASTSTGEAAVGRFAHTIQSLTPEQKAERMAELWEERKGQLDTLARLFRHSK